MLNIYSLIIIGSWLLIILIVSYLCSKLFPDAKELTRKIVHIGSGPVIPLAWWLKVPNHLAIPIAFFITITLIINYKFNIISSIENIERKSFGTIAYGISITILLIFFWADHPSAVAVGVLVMAFGDGLASLIGRRLKSPTWKILGQKKSRAGTFTMGIVTTLVLLSINQIIETPINIRDILFITSLAVSLEQVGPFGIDNITVPIGVAACWNWLLLS